MSRGTEGVLVASAVCGRAPCHRVSPSGAAPRAAALLLHGYGQSRHEALPLAVALAEAGYLALVPDLPGHGAHAEPLSADAALETVGACMAELRVSGLPVHAVGFSMGARLALATDAATVVAVSPPGLARFEGARDELLRVLRPRHVTEAAPFAGLRETLARLGAGWALRAPALAIAGRLDLASVRDFVAQAPPVVRRVQVAGADHHATWWSPQTRAAALEWLAGHAR